MGRSVSDSHVTTSPTQPENTRQPCPHCAISRASHATGSPKHSSELSPQPWAKGAARAAKNSSRRQVFVMSGLLETLAPTNPRYNKPSRSDWRFASNRTNLPRPRAYEWSMSETFLVTGFEPFGEHRTNS